MTTPLVSVVLPTRNRADLVERAIDSVLGQTETRFELLVVDDASTDGTAELLARVGTRDARVRVLRNAEPLGGGGARNRGIDESRGAWIAFLDDDDEWLSCKLTRQLERLASRPDAVACACWFEQHFPSGRTQVFRALDNPTLAQVMAHNVLGGASVCVCSRDALVFVGGFDARLKSSQDYDLWIRLRERGEITVCAEPLVRYHEHDGERITGRGSAQLLGFRRAFLKHRYKMALADRRAHVAFACFLISCQRGRSRASRWHHLLVAVRNAPARSALSYAFHGTTSLLKDSIS